MSQAGHVCVGACEIDKYARSVYAKHFPNIRIWEDATKLNPKELPDFECLTAGFPCQSFSIAGARRGFEDTRGSLFFEIARIAKEKRPRYLLLENVKGLLSSKTIITSKDATNLLYEEIISGTRWEKTFTPINNWIWFENNLKAYMQQKLLNNSVYMNGKSDIYKEKLELNYEQLEQKVQVGLKKRLVFLTDQILQIIKKLNSSQKERMHLSECKEEDLVLSLKKLCLIEDLKLLDITTLEKTMDMLEDAELLQKRNLVENSGQERLFTISMGIRWMIDQKIFGFVQEALILLYIFRLWKLSNIFWKRILLSLMKKKENTYHVGTFNIIIKTLEDIGYRCEWQVLNTKYFLPQNRERVFIIGHSREYSRRKIFPLGEDNKKITEPRLNQLNKTFHDTGRIYHPDGIARSLRANSGGMGSKTGLYAVKELQLKRIKGNIYDNQKNPQCGRIYDESGISPTVAGWRSDARGFIAVTKDHDKLRKTKDESLAIDANYWKGPNNHGQKTMIYMAHSKGNIKQRIQERENVWTITDNARDFGVIEPSIVADRSRTYAGKGRNLESPKEISNSLTSVCKDNYLLRDTRIRRLTPKECERLQGFEDFWTLYGKDGEEISDTQRYKMCGNAISVPVVKYVAENLE